MAHRAHALKKKFQTFLIRFSTLGCSRIYFVSACIFAQELLSFIQNVFVFRHEYIFFPLFFFYLSDATFLTVFTRYVKHVRKRSKFVHLDRLSSVALVFCRYSFSNIVFCAAGESKNEFQPRNYYSEMKSCVYRRGNVLVHFLCALESGAWRDDCAIVRVIDGIETKNLFFLESS